jgi:uncharacterized protein YxjI
MFNETRYVVEKKRVVLRPTYQVKDVNGNLLGYVKGQRLKPNYWFEDVDGTRLDEIRGAEHYEVYDVQNRLRGIIKRETTRGWREQLTEGPIWQIEDDEGQLLAEVKQSGMFLAEYQILAPDGDIIAQIHKERGISQLIRLADSYRIDISRRCRYRLDPELRDHLRSVYSRIDITSWLN